MLKQLADSSPKAASSIQKEVFSIQLLKARMIPDFNQGPGSVSRGTYLRLSDPYQTPSILSFSTAYLQ